jgi:PIN domain nuclease of toxin-antitoxin system
VTVVLDTHVWVWWLTPHSPLSPHEREALDALALRRSLSIAAISLWEAQMLHRKGRLDLPFAFADWLERAADERMIRILPLDVPVVLALDALPPSFRGDAADRIIIATAKAHSLPVATRDKAIRRARIVPVWKA